MRLTIRVRHRQPKRPKQTIYLKVRGVRFPLLFRKGTKVSVQLVAGQTEFFEFEVDDDFGNTKRLSKGFTFKSEDESLAAVEMVRENVAKVISHGPMESTPKFEFTYGSKTIEIEGLIDIGEIQGVRLIPVSDPDAPTTTPTV